MNSSGATLRLSPRDFEDAFGAALDPQTISEVRSHDFRLQPIVGEARDSLVIEILEKIRGDQQIVGDPARERIWESGWQENLEDFRSRSDHTLLVPRFIRPNQPIRWQGKFYSPANPNFETSFTRVLRSFIFGKIDSEIGGSEQIDLYEFGAGTGWNLVHAYEWFRAKNRPLQIFGSDFVDSSVQILRLLREEGIPISASKFDMRIPDPGYRMTSPQQTGVFTLGALEQLADQIEPMIDYLISQNPAIVIHVEPAIENYDSGVLEDYLGAWFQGKRGYSQGLGALLGRKANEGRLHVLSSKRIGFGSKMMEGYNLFVWRPLQD